MKTGRMPPSARIGDENQPTGSRISWEDRADKLKQHWLPGKTSDNLPNEITWENGEKRPTGDDSSSKQAVAGSSPVTPITDIAQTGGSRRFPSACAPLTQDSDCFACASVRESPSGWLHADRLSASASTRRRYKPHPRAPPRWLSADPTFPLRLGRNSRLRRISTPLPPLRGMAVSSHVLPGATTLESMTV